MENAKKTSERILSAHNISQHTTYMYTTHDFFFLHKNTSYKWRTPILVFYKRNYVYLSPGNVGTFIYRLRRPPSSA